MLYWWQKMKEWRVRRSGSFHSLSLSLHNNHSRSRSRSRSHSRGSRETDSSTKFTKKKKNADSPLPKIVKRYGVRKTIIETVRHKHHRYGSVHSHTRANPPRSGRAETTTRHTTTLKVFDIESLHDFYTDDTYVYKTFDHRKAEHVAGWLFELTARKIFARMDGDIAAALTHASPVVVDGKLALKIRQHTCDLQTRYPTSAKIILDAVRLLTKVTYGLQKHHLMWLDLKPEQIVVTSRDTLRLIDFEDVCPAEAWIRQKGYICRGTSFYMSPEERHVIFRSGAYNTPRTPSDAAAIATYRLGMALLVIAAESPTYMIPDCPANPSNSGYDDWLDAAILEGKASRRAIAAEMRCKSKIDHPPLSSSFPPSSSSFSPFSSASSASSSFLSSSSSTLPALLPALSSSEIAGESAKNSTTEELPEEFWTFVRACVARNPHERPTLDALIAPDAPWARLFSASTTSLIPAKTTRGDLDGSADVHGSPARVDPIDRIFDCLWESYDIDNAKTLLEEHKCTPEDLLVRVDAWTTRRALLFFASSSSS